MELKIKKRIECFFRLYELDTPMLMEGRRFLADEKKLPRVLVDVPGDVAKDGIHVCTSMRMCVRVSGSP